MRGAALELAAEPRWTMRRGGQVLAHLTRGDNTQWMELFTDDPEAPVRIARWRKEPGV